MVAAAACTCRRTQRCPASGGETAATATPPLAGSGGRHALAVPRSVRGEEGGNPPQVRSSSGLSLLICFLSVSASRYCVLGPDARPCRRS
ncbi:hypothetical protein NDU88_003795 [Pleurodeles waltl]|uniref:Uncharacterized protein n=1 Tax=Pleurodeles waltl TaxID=8319 RepID=A0AAV7LG89_PLEWA|nr:hypothetical protein NDU88_003795 [Pleurodeles waltl]